jgi:hypothetical protein
VVGLAVVDRETTCRLDAEMLLNVKAQNDLMGTALVGIDRARGQGFRGCRQLIHASILALDTKGSVPRHGDNSLSLDPTSRRLSHAGPDRKYMRWITAMGKKPGGVN